MRAIKQNGSQVWPIYILRIDEKVKRHEFQQRDKVRAVLCFDSVVSRPLPTLDSSQATAFAAQLAQLSTTSQLQAYIQSDTVPINELLYRVALMTQAIDTCAAEKQIQMQKNATHSGRR
jgi:hypothetical protein